MAGAGGFEPPNAGSKVRCLSHLATPQERTRSSRRSPGGATRSPPPGSCSGPLPTPRPGEAAPLDFAAAEEGRPWLAPWDRSPALARPPTGGDDPSLWRLTVLAAERLRLGPGDVRLVGWTGEELPGVDVSPRAAQRTLRTVVLVHLRRGPLPVARQTNHFLLPGMRRELRRSEVRFSSRLCLLLLRCHRFSLATLDASSFRTYICPCVSVAQIRPRFAS